jgi:pyruvate,water dikinase
MQLSEGHRLQPGDVLVARTTMPAWTPFFAVASAVITETGGVLSHAAVVAREYGIPAVLNVTDAARIIRDGQLIEVDGSAGVVRMLG